jgi:hypothetical protein
LVLFVPFLRTRSARACKPLNLQSLISHLTNSNGCGNLSQGSADRVPVSSLPSFSSKCLFKATLHPSAEFLCRLAKLRLFSSLPPLGFSWLSFSHSLPLFSTVCALFCKNTRGGGTSAHPHHAFLPPSYAPRGASIPCGLTRLRILPVTTGVYDQHSFCVCGESDGFALCFHNDTKPCSRNPFPFTSIQNARGGGCNLIFVLATKEEDLLTGNGAQPEIAVPREGRPLPFWAPLEDRGKQGKRSAAAT